MEVKQYLDLACSDTIGEKTVDWMSGHTKSKGSVIQGLKETPKPKIATRLIKKQK